LPIPVPQVWNPNIGGDLLAYSFIIQNDLKQFILLLLPRFFPFVLCLSLSFAFRFIFSFIFDFNFPSCALLYTVQLSCTLIRIAPLQTIEIRKQAFSKGSKFFFFKKKKKDFLMNKFFL
jgi:hypothetical protein